MTGKSLAAQRRKGCARVGERVDADAKPRHSATAADADYAEAQNDSHFQQFKVLQNAEIENNDRANENLKNHQKANLRN